MDLILNSEAQEVLRKVCQSTRYEFACVSDLKYKKMAVYEECLI